MEAQRGTEMISFTGNGQRVGRKARFRQAFRSFLTNVCNPLKLDVGQLAPAPCLLGLSDLGTRLCGNSGIPCLYKNSATLRLWAEGDKLQLSNGHESAANLHPSLLSALHTDLATSRTWPANTMLQLLV
eukprot:1145511-Amphidinium_carterae.1